MVVEFQQAAAQPSGLSLLFSKEYTTGANIAAGATSAEVYITENEQWEAAPFDALVIQNMDIVPVAINLNQNTATRIVVQAGQTFIAENQVFRYFDITNLDAAVAHTAGKLKILVQKRGERRR